MPRKKKVKCKLLPNGKRNYKCEYEKYGGASKEGKRLRNLRNQARRKMKRLGLVKKGDSKEVDHKRPLSKGGTNARKNLRIVSRKKNRTKGARRK
jgi:5-methylcytosine-specific restriction endonuclease McrA